MRLWTDSWADGATPFSDNPDMAEQVCEANYLHIRAEATHSSTSTPNRRLL